ncbi:MAG: hypothetical protein PVH68_02090 [Armatimonadota bacterium]
MVRSLLPLAVLLRVAASVVLAKGDVPPRPAICFHQGKLYAGPYLRRIDRDTGAAQVLWDKGFITCMASDGRDLWLGTRLETVVRLRFGEDGSIAEEQEWSLLPILHRGVFPHRISWGEDYGVYDLRAFPDAAYAFTGCGYAELDRAGGDWQRRRAFAGPDREPIGLIGDAEHLAFLSLQRAPVEHWYEAQWVIQSVGTHRDLLTIPARASLQGGTFYLEDRATTKVAAVEYRRLCAILPGEDHAWLVPRRSSSRNGVALLRYEPDTRTAQGFRLGYKHGTLCNACRHGDTIWLLAHGQRGGSLIRFDCNTHTSELFTYEGPVRLERLVADDTHVFILGQLHGPEWWDTDTSRIARFEIATREFTVLPTPPVDITVEHMWGPDITP